MIKLKKRLKCNGNHARQIKTHNA
nr:hypothetical protein [Mogibacterium timidum]